MAQRLDWRCKSTEFNYFMQLLDWNYFSIGPIESAECKTFEAKIIMTFFYNQLNLLKLLTQQRLKKLSVCRGTNLWLKKLLASGSRLSCLVFRGMKNERRLMHVQILIAFPSFIAAIFSCAIRMFPISLAIKHVCAYMICTPHWLWILFSSHQTINLFLKHNACT